MLLLGWLLPTFGNLVVGGRQECLLFKEMKRQKKIYLSCFSSSMLLFTKQKGPLSNIKLLSLCSGLVVRAYLNAAGDYECGKPRHSSCELPVIGFLLVSQQSALLRPISVGCASFFGLYFVEEWLDWWMFLPSRGCLLVRRRGLAVNWRIILLFDMYPVLWFL